MAEFFFNYGLFFLKALTVLVVFAGVVIIVVAASASQKNHDSDGLCTGQGQGKIEINDLNIRLDSMKHKLEQAVLAKAQLKQCEKDKKKQQKKQDKADKKAPEKNKKRVFVIDFDGDIKASAVDQLREEVTAILTIATPNDEVVCRLESPGGMVHGYGLAASQLCRFREAEIPLTVCIDKVAASGGYMMAVAATKILAAPFAIVGSVGVVAQIPNIHRLLKKHSIDVELHTAGEYKRTLTMLGENTEEGRKKFLEDLQETHELFKDHIAILRPSLNVDSIATGEVWYGSKAVDVGLIDGITTSDTYLSKKAQGESIYEVRYSERKALGERLGIGAAALCQRLITAFVEKGSERQLP